MSEIASLEQRIARLEAIEAIKQLKAHYLTSCDTKKPEAVRNCFAEGEVLIDYEAVGQFTKRDDFVNIFEQYGCRDNIVDMHHAHNPEIEILDEGHAKGRWELFFYTFDKDSGATMQLSGIYDDEFTRVDGDWKIVKTVFRRISVLGGQIDPQGEVILSMGAPTIYYSAS